jgi:Sortase domain
LTSGVAVRAALLATLAVLLVNVPADSPDMHARGAADLLRRPTASGSPLAVDGFQSVRTYNAIAEPVRLRIPAVQVDTGLQRLGRNPDGTIAVPDSPHTAGWYAEGPRPGQLGPAVVVGHVDSTDGPGVFFRLDDLAPGSVVYVDRADGTTTGFVVTRKIRTPKTQFPTDLVYSPTLEPSLYLVTCGGSFDRGTERYRDNVVVSAVPA